MDEKDLKYLDDILMRTAEELMITDIPDLISMESFIDDDEEDIDKLLAIEGFMKKASATKQIMANTKPPVGHIKSRSDLIGLRNNFMSQFRYFKDDPASLKEITNLTNNLNNRIKELDAKYETYDKISGTDAVKRYELKAKREYRFYKSKLDSLINEHKLEEKHREDSEKHKAHRDRVIEEDRIASRYKAEDDVITLKGDNGTFSIMRSASNDSKIRIIKEEIKDRKARKEALKIALASNIRSEGVPATENFVEGAMLITLGASLFGGLIALKQDKRDHGLTHSAEARPYYYILSNEFKKSEKSLKTLLRGNKRFITSKVVLEEIVAFRKKYYNRVALTVNRFMEAFESVEDLIGKEKQYMFNEINPVRDAAIMSKLNHRFAKFYEIKHSNFSSNAAEVLAYEPSYSSSTDTTKVIVDSKYLDELLVPTETFRCIEVLEGVIKKIPSIDDARRYEELLLNAKGESAGPIKMYTSAMLDLRDLALEIRSILNYYINIVFAILDFCVIANEKYSPPTDIS